MIHSLIRALAMAVAIASFPFTALLCRAAALLAVNILDEVLSGKPLPVVTSFFIGGQAHSLAFFLSSIVIALLLAIVAAWLFRLPEANPWRATGQILVTGLAAGLSLALLACTLIGVFFPLTGGIISGMGKTSEYSVPLRLIRPVS